MGHRVALRLAALLAWAGYGAASLAQPANDQCNAPEVLPYPASVAFDLGPAAASTIAGCGVNDSVDLWYQFRAPSRQSYRFETTGDAGIDTTLALFGFCPAGGPGSGTWIVCNDDTPFRDATATLGSRIDQELVGNQIVLIRVAGWGGSRPAGLLTVSTAHVGDAPRNDACEQAQTLRLDGSVFQTTGGATGADISTCGINDTADVWYRFAAPIAGMYEFVIDHPDYFATLVSVYEGCDDDGGGELACGNQRASVALNAGQAVLARVAVFEEQVGQYLLTVRQAGEPAPARPTHADCSGAIAMAAPGSVYGQTAGGDRNVGFGGACASSAYGPAAYVRVNVPTPGLWVIDSAGSPDEIPFFLAAFEGCTGGGVFPESLLACDQPQSAITPSRLIVETTQPNQTLIVYVAATLYRSGLFRLNVQPIPEPPDNQFCFAARPVGVPSLTIQDNSFSTPEVGPTCSFDDLFALWFEFTAPQDGAYKFDGRLSDVAAWFNSVAVLDNCGGNVLKCNQSVIGPSAVGLTLTAGQRVLVRIGTDGSWRGRLALRVSRDGDQVIETSPGACCAGLGGCTIEADAAACAAISGAFVGINASCGPLDNRINCCPANVDRIGGVTLDDLFGYLFAYFSGGPEAEIDGVAGVGVGDLFAFLAVWFAGCD